MDNKRTAVKTAKILVVDDESGITGLLEDALSRDGHAVVAASSGEEALQKAGELSPDLILMDIVMPEMDGYEATVRLRQLPGLHGTPVIFLSGKPAEEDGGRAFAVGAAAYLRKPFSERQIRDIVNLALSPLSDSG